MDLLFAAISQRGVFEDVEEDCGELMVYCLVRRVLLAVFVAGDADDYGQCERGCERLKGKCETQRPSQRIDRKRKYVGKLTRRETAGKEDKKSDFQLSNAMLRLRVRLWLESYGHLERLYWWSPRPPMNLSLNYHGSANYYALV